MVNNIILEKDTTKPNRNSNIELYRIIVMLFIIAHHYVVNSGLMEKMQESPMSPQSLLAERSIFMHNFIDFKHNRHTID